MKKNFLATLVILGCLTSVISGCNTSDVASNKMNPDASNTLKSTSDKQVITVWCWDPLYNVAIMEQAAKTYTAEHPNVEIQIMDVADSEQKLHIGFSSGSSEGLPDILLNQDYTIEKFLDEYPGEFVDLTNEFDYSQFAEYKVDLMTVDGKTYGVPFDSGAVGLFYRRDYLEQAGYLHKDLQDLTWEQYIEIGKDVKEKTGKAMLCTNASTTYKELISMMLQASGEWFYDEGGRVDYVNNKVLKEAIEVIKSIEEAGITVSAADWSAWVGKMNDGSVATVPQAIWVSASIQAATDQSGLWGIVPLPKLDIEGAAHYANNGGSSWYVLESSANKKTAIDFLKSTYTGNIDFYQDILTNQGALGTYIPAADGVAYTAPHEFYNGQAIYAEVSEWMTKIPGQRFGIYYTEARDMLANNFPDLFSGTLSIDQFLKKSEDMLKAQMQ